MRPTRLYLLRHGETAWNLARRYQGTLDSPLSDAGRAQSARLAEALRAVPLAAVYSSPLPRALAAAEAIAARHGLAVTAHEGLSEIRVGAWEGLTVAEIEARYADDARAWRETPHLARIPGGETIAALRARAAAAAEEIRARHEGAAVAVVAHGGVNKTILLTALGAPLSAYWRLRQHNACINVIEYRDGRAVVLVLNETSHLTGPAAGTTAPVHF